MAFLCGAEQMVNPSVRKGFSGQPSLRGSGPLPGKAHRSLPHSTVSFQPEEPTCICCSHKAEHATLQCGHSYCTSCYVKLFSRESAAFSCNQEHEEELHVEYASTSRWKSRSSGYETIPNSEFTSRAESNVSKKSGALKAVLEKFCFGKADDDEGFGSSPDEEIRLEIPVEEPGFPDVVPPCVAPSVESHPVVVPSCVAPSVNSHPAASIHSDVGFGEINYLSSEEFVSVELARNVGRPAEPLEPEAAINQTLMVVLVNELRPGVPEPQYRYCLPHTVVDVVIDHGTTKYQFDGPNSVLYEPINQALLIADTLNRRIKKHDVSMNCLGLCAYVPELEDGQLRKPTHLASHQGRILTADCGAGLVDARVQLFNIDGRRIRPIGDNRLIDPSHMVVVGDTLYVLDCNTIKQFMLSPGDDEYDEDAYIGDLDLPPEFGDIQCFSKPDEHRLFIADDKCICIVSDSCRMIPLSEKPVDMIVDSSGFLLILFNDCIRVFTPFPDIVLYCRIALPPGIDYRSFSLLPNGTLVCCGHHGYVQIEFRSSSTILPTENTETADPVQTMISLTPTRV